MSPNWLPSPESWCSKNAFRAALRHQPALLSDTLLVLTPWWSLVIPPAAACGPVVDAVSAGFRVIIPRQCVADRVSLTHLVNLFDIDSKYGDVMDVEDVIAAFQRLPATLSGCARPGAC